LRSEACPVERLAGMRSVLEVQDAMLSAARKSLARQGFLEIRPPIVAPATDPGLRGAKKFEIDFYGSPWKVTSSMILQKMLAASALGKIFALSPCLRKESLESAKTGRHLCEFWQIDAELRKASRDEAMTVAETMLHDVMEEVAPFVKEKMGIELRIPAIPLKRLTYPDALKMARELGFAVEDGKEIPWDAEKAISERFLDPFFITDYPRGSRGFYDKVDEKRPDKLLAFDMLYPHGFGEALSGSQREDVPELSMTKLMEIGEDPEAYGWYLDLLREGRILPTAGFGFGVERMTRFICDLDTVAEASAFPRLPGGGGL